VLVLDSVKVNEHVKLVGKDHFIRKLLARSAGFGKFLLRGRESKVGGYKDESPPVGS